MKKLTAIIDIIRGCFGILLFNKKVKRMNDKDIIISHALDLKEKSATESVVTYTHFLSTEELSAIIKKERVNNEFVDTFYYGGFEEAERKVAFFVPKFYDAKEEAFIDFLSENEANPLVILNIAKDKFANLTHRDYLGALMGLGIKREMIGDIIVNEDGCLLVCLASISDYICGNLKQAGRGQLKVTAHDINSFKYTQSKTETFFVSVASMRIDCLVAAAFKMSRNTAVNNITQGFIYVNGEQILKTDYLLQQGDKLVLRGKGKTVIEEVIGESKKGRLHINIKRYI